MFNIRNNYMETDTLCWDCANAYGDCEWTEEGTDGKTAFQPVPGWKVKQRKILRGETFEELTRVVECPKFLPEPGRTVHNRIKKP